MELLSRRNFLKTGMTTVGLAAGIGTGYLYRHNEANDPVIDRVQIPIKNLPDDIEGFTIAILADFHLYPLTTADLVQKAVLMTNLLKPDLTVLLGDYVWKEVDAVFELAPILAQLNAKHGVYSIMGNHDLWTNVKVVRQGFTEAGLPLLENRGIPLTVGQDTLYLAGIDDGWSGQPDLNAALADRPADAPVILLAHEPDLADDFSQDGRIDLQLSGHTHAGQVRFKRLGPLILPYLGRKYDMGLYHVNDMWVYTNRGIGVTNEPVRFNCPPEITEITLVRA